MVQTYRCPVCGAELQENAQFCLHCMTSFAPKQQIPDRKEPKSKSKRIVIATVITAVTVLLIIGAVIFISVNNKSKPICKPEEFLERVPLVSERLGAEELWDSRGFQIARQSNEEDILEYSTEISLSEDAFLSVVFDNGGLVLSANVWDVPEDKTDDAEKLICCITDSFINNYLENIDEIVRGSNQFPYLEYEKPFEEYFTDVVNKTDIYNKMLSQGADISTSYITAADGDLYLVFYKTKKETADGVSYDLTVYIERNRFK